MRLMTLTLNVLVSMARLVGSLGPRARRRTPSDGWHILVTGTFYSDSWIRSHIPPLTRSGDCTCVWVVSTVPVPSLPKVRPVYPPRWLVRSTGSAVARLLMLVHTAVFRRPDVIGGFVLVPNGLAAA
jgi:L-malate glycosyltransferase